MENFDKIKEEITKLQTSYAAIREKSKEIKADAPDNQSLYDMMCSIMDNMDARMRYVWEAINYSDERYYKHLKGHIPSLSPSQLQKVLDKTGLGDDFKIEKPIIWASTNGRKTNFVAEYKKPIT